MLTVEPVLLKIVNCTDPVLEDFLPLRDSRLLRSLVNSMTSQQFITENQANLIVKLINVYLVQLTQIVPDLATVMKSFSWSRDFRMVAEYKKLLIQKNSVNNELSLLISFSYKPDLGKLLQQNNKKITGITQTVPGKIYSADLTEHNIVTLVDLLSPLQFDIDSEIINHYHTIRSWQKQDVLDSFQLTHISNTNFTAHMADQLDHIHNNQLIAQDRSFRYQYHMPDSVSRNDTLIEYIAYRNKSKVWVNSSTHTLAELVSSLISLQRAPIMFVFSDWEHNMMYQQLLSLHAALEQNQLNQNVGVYFRLPNQPVGKLFNQLVLTNHYNHDLTDATQVVVVQANKIPKFIVRNQWMPMSTVVLDSIRSNKTTIYANSCDLIVSYCATKPLMDAGAYHDS